MATTTTITKILFRRGNDADRLKTILASGEPGFALDTGRMFLGDGSTPGGVPIVATADHHLQYVDETGEIEGNFSRHNLDVNVQGLSATLAGDRLDPDYARTEKLFHPTDRIVDSNYPMHLTGINDGVTDWAKDDGDETPGVGNNLSIMYTNEQGNDFTIGRKIPGVINIGDVLVIDTASGTLSLKPGKTFAVAAENMLFADADNTLFEDRTVDLNTPIVDEKQVYIESSSSTHGNSAAATTSDATGIYITHSGSLSAGKIAVKDEQSVRGFNTIQIQPPTHDSNWAAPALTSGRLSGQLGIGLLPGKVHHPLPRIRVSDDGGGAFSTPNEWVGGTKVFEYDPGDGDPGTGAFTNTGHKWGETSLYHSKPINIRSVRPKDGTSTAYTHVQGQSNSLTMGSGDNQVTIDVGDRIFDSSNRRWQGNADLVFETGLVVYGPGDPDVQANSELNGYLINQSMDSFAYPTFQGINLEGPNSQPLQVPSGGTGRRRFDVKRLITSGNATDTDPLNTLDMPTGYLLGGKNGEPSPFKPTSTNPWLVINNGQTNITWDNKFSPTYGAITHASITNNPKEMFFDKWSKLLGDTGIGSAKRFDGQLKIAGDMAADKDAHDITTTCTPAAGEGAAPVNSGSGIMTWANDGPTTILNVNHTEHAVSGGAFVKGAITKDVSILTAGVNNLTQPTNAGKNATTGSVINSLTINKSGHIRNVGVIDLDERYPSLIGLGKTSTPSDSATARFSPENVSLTVTELGDNVGIEGVGGNRLYTAANLNTVGDNGASAVTDMQFNKYGTLFDVNHSELTDTFFNKSNINKYISVIGRELTELQDAGEDFVHKKKHNNIDANLLMMNNHGISFHEGSSTNSPNLAGIQLVDSLRLKIQAPQGIDIFNTHSTKTIKIHSGNTAHLPVLEVKSTDINLNPGNTNVVGINSNGIVMSGFNNAGGKYGGASTKVLYGTATNATDSEYVNVQEVGEYAHSQSVPNTNLHNDPNWTLYPTFVIAETDRNKNGTASRNGYRQVLADNNLHYNPNGNYFGGEGSSPVVFIGDGNRLDLSNNPSVPSSLELNTAGSGLHNLVLSKSDRGKIYDKTNTAALDSTAGHLYIRGDVVAFNNFSDKRLKKNITTIDSKQSLDKVLQLSGVTFEWKDAPERGERLGLIAQQVEEIVPQVVTESPRVDDMTKTYKQVDYEALVPLLIESIKELTARVAELETR